MFKKRERPQAKRKEDSSDDDAKEEKVKVITALKKKRPNELAQHSGSGGASSSTALPHRKQEEQVLSRERVANDLAFSGIKTNNEIITDAGDKSGIFAISEVETARDQDHRAILERNQKISDAILKGELKEGIYRGQGAYKQVISRREGAIAASKYTGTMGPIRGNTAGVKVNTRFDYWGTSGDGGVCKEYKLTGYCGYGDSCIYMHDRSDYKSGWQLDREFDEQEKLKNQKLEARLARQANPDAAPESEDEDEDSDSDSEEGKMPRDCQLCRKDWADCETDPVITQCKHFFCETCALENYQEDRKCAVCGADTKGIFNNASAHLERRMAKRERQILEKKEPKKPDFSKNLPYSAEVRD